MGIKRIINRVFLPKVPPAVLSWRYILPQQSHATQLHRKVFLLSFSRKPKALWLLVNIHTYLLWYLCNSWRQCYRTWHLFSAELNQKKHIPPKKQLRDLLYLALLHSIPPHHYYQYSLYLYPKNKWMNFIFTHELPTWHQLMSPHISKESQDFLSDKALFSQRVIQQGLEGIPTSKELKKGLKIDDSNLFQKKSIFIKPRRGSRKSGCYSLIYDGDKQTYSLSGEDAVNIIEKDIIKHWLNHKLAERDYLLQPLLINHPDMMRLFPCSALMTVRIVTQRAHDNTHKDGVNVMSAILEVPLKDEFKLVYPIPIELNSGKLIIDEILFQKMNSAVTTDVKAIHHAFSNKHLPHWKTVTSLALKAHSQCLDLATVGWDIGITDTGVRLIEANFNWAVAPHQPNDTHLMSAFIQLYVQLDNAASEVSSKSNIGTSDLPSVK